MVNLMHGGKSPDFVIGISHGLPDVLLEIRHRGSSRDGWRIADFSIQNRTDKQLLVREIALGFDSSGIRIAPATAEEGDVWRMDRERIGRTISFDQTSSTADSDHSRQRVHVRHPLDVVDFRRHTVKISILLEQEAAPKKGWWTTIEGQIPQESGDPVTFSETGPLDCRTKTLDWA
jgi:hypothetical protein